MRQINISFQSSILRGQVSPNYHSKASVVSRIKLKPKTNQPMQVNSVNGCSRATEILTVTGLKKMKLYTCRTFTIEMTSSSSTVLMLICLWIISNIKDGLPSASSDLLCERFWVHQNKITNIQAHQHKRIYHTDTSFGLSRHIED